LAGLAVTNTIVAEVTVVGAVYIPVEEIEPIAGMRNQVAGRSCPLLDLTENCWALPGVNVTAEGLIASG
jgi:hypothetical protein